MSVQQAIHNLYRVKLLAAEYSDRLPSSKEAQFLATCAHMLEGRGYVTSNMQRWLDDLLEKGGPADPTQENLALADQLAETAPHAGVQREFMEDMISRLRAGTPVTEKQLSAACDLHERIKACLSREDLSADELRAMAIAENVFYGYNADYRTARFGSFRRASQIIEKFKIAGDINRVDWEAITAAMPRLKEIAYPAHAHGDLLYNARRGELVVVCGTPEIDKWGAVVYNVLMDGNISQVNATHLRKRAPRG